MPEPLSIVAAAATLATSLLRCIDCLRTIHQRITTVDQALENLQTELKALQRQVGAVRSKQFQQSGYDEYWTEFNHAVQQCKRKVGDMEHHLARIAGTEGGLFGARKVKN